MCISSPAARQECLDEITCIPFFCFSLCWENSHSQQINVVPTMAPKTPKPYPYYNYHPLPTGSIRLLKIDSVSVPSRNPVDNIQDDLRICMRSYPLSCCPAYVALSYTWGESGGLSLESARPQVFTQEERCFPISCDGRIILGTRNLRSALRHLRMRSQLNKHIQGHGGGEGNLELLNKFGCAEHFWIDALCIDQEDIGEKQQQIPLMGQIYQSAQLCLVWLGEADARSDSGIAWMMKIAQDQSLRNLSRSEALESKLKFMQRFQDILSEIPRSMTLAAHVFLSRSWFQRVWILQEVVLPEKVLVVCGTRQVDLDALLLAAFLISQANVQLITESLKGLHSVPVLRREPLNEAMVKSQDTIKRLRNMRYFRGQRKAGLTMSFLMARSLSSGSKASVPHDHVYGILGLCHEFQETPDDGQEFQVTYQHSAQQVYAYATGFLLQRQRDLKILYLVDNRGDKDFPPSQGNTCTRSADPARSQPENSYENLPSWCPDYSSMNSETFDMTLSMPGSEFAPSPWGSLEPRIEMKDCSMLGVNGMYYDHVGQVYCPSQTPQEHLLNMMELAVCADAGKHVQPQRLVATPEYLLKYTIGPLKSVLIVQHHI